MINGFNERTKKLTDFENRIIKIMVPKLKMNIGKKKAVTNREITSQLKILGYKVSAVRLRKVIHHIRINKLVTNLVSTSDGYYRAENQEDVEKYVKSLQQRINSIAEVKNSFI
jgi:predicted GTPase